MSRLWWMMAGGSAILFAALAILSKGWVEPAGQVIFDSRLFGYDAQAAEVFRAALSSEQRQLYLGVFRTLDTAFPILLGLTMASLVLHHWVAGRKMTRSAAAMVICAYVFFDLSENALVAQILRAEEAPSVELVARASAYTTCKWVAFGLAGLLSFAIWRGAEPTEKGQQDV